ncbi:MAG: type III polyketide synthase [Pirellulaceae bacterium]
MSFFVQSIGTAVPSGSIGQEDAAKLSQHYCCPTPEQARLLPVLYRRTRVEMRHSVLLGEQTSETIEGPDFYKPAVDESDLGPTTHQRMQVYQQYASDLGVAASNDAFARCDVQPGEITHLITVSCTGFCAPGFDVEIARKLGLSADVARTHVGFMGCHGALNAIRAAQGFTAVTPSHRVLICAVELCSLHHQYGWDPERIVSNALFADGAAALIVGGDSPNPDIGSLQHVASGTTIVAGTEDQMSWNIGDHGYAMTLAATVPETIRQHLRPWLTKWLKQYNLSPSRIGGWLVHPGGPRILEATSDAMNLDDDSLIDSKTILRTHGNMSSPTVLFVLQEAIRMNRPGPYLMLGFGPGLTIEAALIGK